MDRQDGISGMFNQSPEKLEGCWNYTPPLTGCASLRAVTHSLEECNLCVCLLTQALCSKPQESHVPPTSQFQFPIKVNTVWKCSHTLAQHDGSWFEFSRLIKERVWERSLFFFFFFLVPPLTWYAGLHGSGHSTCWRQEKLDTWSRGLIKTTCITSTATEQTHTLRQTHIHMFTWL